MNNELNKRIFEYRKEMKDYLVNFYSFIFLLSLVVSFTFFWFLANDPKEHLPIDWRLMALLCAIVMAIPPFFVLKHEKPTAEEVSLDSLFKENQNSE